MSPTPSSVSGTEGLSVKAKAFTRAVSPKLAKCELTHRQRVPIDTARACKQHGAYEAALRDAGLTIVRLQDLPDHADGVFVEDTAVLLGRHAIITRPGANSRAREAESTAQELAAHFELHRIEEGHVDGGDVLRIGRTLYVGLSSRTDPAGVAALQRTSQRLGFDVVPVKLRDCLHLKTAATVAGRGRSGALILVYNPLAVEAECFSKVEAMAVDTAETAAANVLDVGQRVIMPAGYPKTAGMLRRRGIDVVEVDVSELEKAEAGVTCMSLISDTDAHS